MANGYFGLRLIQRKVYQDPPGGPHCEGTDAFCPGYLGSARSPIVRKEGRKPLQTQPPGMEGGLWKLSEFKLNWYNVGNDGGVIYQQAPQANTQAFETLVLLTPGG